MFLYSLFKKICIYNHFKDGFIILELYKNQQLLTTLTSKLHSFNGTESTDTLWQRKYADGEVNILKKLWFTSIQFLIVWRDSKSIFWFCVFRISSFIFVPKIVVQTVKPTKIFQATFERFLSCVFGNNILAPLSWI